MRLFFIIPFVMFIFLWGSVLFPINSNAYLVSQKEEQIQHIGAQIQELEDMKKGFESRALYYEDKANQLQFDDQTYLEMRRYTQIAEENRSKAAATQKEIDRLEAEKSKLLSWLN